MDQADAWYSHVRICLQWSFTGVYENIRTSQYFTRFFGTGPGQHRRCCQQLRCYHPELVKMTNSTSPPLQALSSRALLPRAGLEYGHIYRVPIGRKTGMGFQASLALNWFYDKQACWLGIPCLSPRVALADEEGHCLDYRNRIWA